MLNPNDAKLIKLALRKVRFIIESTNNGFLSFQKDNQVDNELLYAISKALEYIGERLNPEAKFHLPISKNLVNSNNNIAWKRITQIRNRLEHNYSREIKVGHILGILDDIGTLDKQLKGILIANNEQTDKYFDHKDHNKDAHYKNHVNLLLLPDEFFADFLFEAVKGEDLLTDEQRFIVIEKNLHLMKLFLSDLNQPVLMKDENRLLREKKISALERTIEIIGQASKEVDEKIAQKITEMLKANNQGQLMALWISLRTKRDIAAHAEKSPDLKNITKNAEELAILQPVIVSFLAKEYNFVNTNLFNFVTSVVEKYTKLIEKFKTEFDGEFKKLEKILEDINKSETDIMTKKAEYQEQIKKAFAMRKQYLALHAEISTELKKYAGLHKQIITLHPSVGLKNQLESLDKTIHELDELIKSIQVKTDFFEKAYQEAVQQKENPKKIEKASELNFLGKRKQSSKKEKDEPGRKEASSSDDENEKKRKAEEEATQHTTTSPRSGI